MPSKTEVFEQSSFAALKRHSPAANASLARTGYRADIDGLRALAVVAVVASHAGVPGCTGGFIGVDVFFVISGYLITRNLEHAPPADWHGLLGFYGRRMRRTLPALYLVAACTLAAGLCLLLPGELDDLARSTLAALLVVPNIFFLTQAGYFDHAAIGKPLLHTWSLGIEEQFYLVAPLLPWALGRLDTNRRKIVLLALFAGALACCVALQAVAPAAAFYLLPARLWEFLAGALVAARVLPASRAPWLAETLATAALIGLVASIGLFSAATPHPSWPTLLPCLATAVLIHVGRTRTTVATQILGSPPLAAIGLISYSVYLWHWPILALARLTGWSFSPIMQLLALPALLALAWLSWRLVEGPFRAPGSLFRRRASTILPTAAGALAVASLAIIVGRGLPARFPADVASVASFYDYRDRKPFREGRCFITSKNRLADFDSTTCLYLDPARRNVLLLGDSHAAHLWTGLRDTRPDLNILQATASGCKPVLGTSGADRCTAMMSNMLLSFSRAHHLDGVILSALWEPDDLAALKATIAHLQPLVGQVTVLGPGVRYDEPVATLLARSMLRGDLMTMRAHELPEVPALDARMQAEIGPLATYVSIYQAVCPDGHCQLFAAPGVPMLFDYHHLTEPGAAVVARLIATQVP